MQDALVIIMKKMTYLLYRQGTHYNTKIVTNICFPKMQSMEKYECPLFDLIY